MNKVTEWKRLALSKEKIDFSNVRSASLDLDGDSFVSLTFSLRDGQVVRLRKSNYDVQVESPVIPMETIYQVKVGQLSTTFKSKQEAEEALGSMDGDIEEIQIPKQQPVLEDLPF